MADIHSRFFFLLTFTCCAGVFAEYCTTDRYTDVWGLYEYSTTYCTDGCCGYSPYQYCCTPPATVAYIGAYIGGAVGGFVFLVIVLVVVCAVCKHASHSGRVIQPATTSPTGTVVYTSGTSGQYPGIQQGYGTGFVTSPPAGAYAPPQPSPYKSAAAPPLPYYSYMSTS